MTKRTVSATAPWSLSTEEFFYVFMGLRKGEIRKQVAVNLDPLYRAGLGGVSVVTANQLIGEAAIWYYGRKAKADIGLQRQGAQSAS